MGPFLLTRSNPIQSNPWMDPIHVQLWATHQKSQLHSGNCMHGLYVQFIQCRVRPPRQRNSRRIRASFVSDVWPKQLS